MEPNLSLSFLSIISEFINVEEQNPLYTCKLTIYAKLLLLSQVVLPLKQALQIMMETSLFETNNWWPNLHAGSCDPQFFLLVLTDCDSAKWLQICHSM